MTTRGIRRKKSYLVDAKIAVCGQKSVGKSGLLTHLIVKFFGMFCSIEINLGIYEKTYFKNLSD